jgi:hypothetical protein
MKDNTPPRDRQWRSRVELGMIVAGEDAFPEGETIPERSAWESVYQFEGPNPTKRPDQNAL